MNVVGARVDALWVAYRVELDSAFTRKLHARSKVATQHGRAGFEWTRVGRREKTRMWGDVRPSHRSERWNITNDAWRLQIDAKAGGGGEIRDCSACRGKGRTTRGECSECDGIGRVEGVGFSVQIIWSAQKLAEWGLDTCLKDSADIARACGNVLEARVQRFDLAVDVSGWTIDPNELLPRLAKRPRAKLALDYQPCLCGKPRGSCTCDGVASSYSGSLSNIKATGISVGRGGALMMRCYDKRAELRARRDDRKTALEYGIWKSHEWDGEGDVARVEFQLRGVVLRELGLRDPECAVEPIFAMVEGKMMPLRWKPCVTEDGEVLGLVDRLDWVWRTCLDWVRLVEPVLTRNGKLRPPSRLPLDPRWQLLHEVTFAPCRAPSKIKRVRVRSSASAAQSLGVGLSQHARDQRLAPMAEGREAYANLDPKTALRLLRGKLRRVKLAEVERVLEYLLVRAGNDLASALDHLAVRNNAARLRHLEHPRDSAEEEKQEKKRPRVFERRCVTQEAMAFN